MKKRLSDADIAEARNADPTPYLQAMGFEVTWDSVRRHAEVRDGCGDEVYRLSRHPDGRFVCCDRYSNKIGQYSGSIDLVLDLEGGSFPGAVARLLGSGRPAQAPGRGPRPGRRPSPPAIPDGAQGDRWIGDGRDYLLRARGISLATVMEAERQGFLGYASDGVLFLGRDESGAARNVAWRSSDPLAEAPKRDLAGSDKSYPQVFMGDPALVAIVEGGVDALATHELYRMRGAGPPTAIVSGGARVSRFLGNPAIQIILAGAGRVAVFLDREKDGETQRATDEAHARQLEKLTGLEAMKNFPKENIGFWKPPAGDKDMADLVLRLKRLLGKSLGQTEGGRSWNSISFQNPVGEGLSPIPEAFAGDYRAYLHRGVWLIFGNGARPGEAPTLTASQGAIRARNRGASEKDILLALSIAARGNRAARLAGDEKFCRLAREVASRRCPGLELASAQAAEPSQERETPKKPRAKT